MVVFVRQPPETMLPDRCGVTMYGISPRRLLWMIVVPLVAVIFALALRQ